MDNYRTPHTTQLHVIERFKTIPPDVMRFFRPITEQSHPPGIAYRPRKLSQYLDDECAIIMKPVTPRMLITFLANKMGGIHLDADRSSMIEYLQNKAVHLYGEGAIYRLFEGCALDICSSLMPLRNEVALALDLGEEITPSMLNWVS